MTKKKMKRITDPLLFSNGKNVKSKLSMIIFKLISAATKKLKFVFPFRPECTDQKIKSKVKRLSQYHDFS